SSFYVDEHARAIKVRQVLKEAKIDLKETIIEGTRYSTDGDIQHRDYRYVIAEMKNEIGSGGAEPYAQASLYYLESTRQQALAHPTSVLPALLVLIFGACISLGRATQLRDHTGPYMAFAGAAWNTRPNVQMLSTAVPFHYHRSDDISHARAARHIAA